MKLQAKLFWALTLLLATVLALFVGLSRIGLQRGIGPFVAEIELARLDWMVANLARAYGEQGRNWDFLKGNDGAWHSLQWPPGSGPSRQGRDGRGPEPGRRAPGDAGCEPDAETCRSPQQGRRGPRGPRGSPQLDVLPGKLMPPPPPDADPRDPRTASDSMYRRLAVLDARGALVIGDAQAGDVRAPIRVNSQTVGWLALAPLQGLASSADRAFISRQSLFIAGAGVAGLLLALAISAWAARRWLLRPIEALAGGAARLAQGHFDARVPATGRDELAALAGTFNAMAAQLAAIEAARTEWLAAAAHELRTPITALRAEIEALQDGVRRFEPATSRRMHAQVMRLTRLIEDLRLVTTETYGLPQDLDLIEPFTLLADVAEAFAPRLQDKALVLSGAADLRALQAAGGATVRGDRLRVEQLLVNLLENSLRYTDAGGEVRVGGHAAGADIVLVVEDSSPAPAHCDRLFERFYRDEASRSREHGGAGLGLAICRTIAQAHKGRIDASPSALGGLRVSVTLPRDEP